MPQTDPLTPLRGQASRTVATNAGLLEMTPSGNRRDPRKADGSPLELLLALPGGVAEAIDHGLEHKWPKAPTGSERWAKRLTDAHLKGVGWVSDAAELALAKDKGRAAAGIVGARVGSALGALVPGAEPVTIPLGAVAGNWAGHELYDHREQIRNAAGRLKDDVDAEIYTLRDQWARELAHMVPYDLPDRIMRR